MLETQQTESASAENQATETSTGQDQPTQSTSESGSSWFEALDKALEADASTDSPSDSSDEAKVEAPAKDAATDKPEETVAEDADNVKNMSVSAGAKFKEIKAEAKAAKARVAELEEKLAIAESSPKVDHEEVSKLKTSIEEREAKIANYEKELAISRFEATDEYRESIVKPMAAILNVVSRMAEKYSVPEKALLGALEEGDPDKQGDLIVELASNFSERDRVSLYQLGDDFSQLLDHREKMRDKAALALDAREKAQKEEESKRKSQAKASWSKATNTVWNKLKDSVPFPSDDSEKAKFEASLLSEMDGLSFDSLSDEHKAFSAFSGSLVPHLLKHNKSLQAEISELKSSLKRYQSATPGAGSGSETKPASVSEGLGFLEALEARFSGG